MDAQGAERARPYIEAARATFKTVVDAQNQLGDLYGFKAIPNGFLIDGDGVVKYKRLGGFDVRRPETREVVEQWATGVEPGAPFEQARVATGPTDAQANSHFREGLELYRTGDVEGAMAMWRRGLEMDPDNYIIRKQIWAVENPERFYDGDVDYAWQREQRSAEP